MCLSDSSKVLQVTQTPAAVHKMESSTLCMECLFQINSSVWALQWNKDGRQLTTSTRISIFTMKGNSTLILRNIEIADSGIYKCILSDHTDKSFPNNGTHLTVEGKIFSSKSHLVFVGSFDFFHRCRLYGDWWIVVRSVAIQQFAEHIRILKEHTM